MKKLFKSFVVEFDDKTITLNPKTQQKVLDMLNWLSINQPKTVVKDGSSFTVRKTEKNGFIIYSYNPEGKYEFRAIKRNALAFASQFLEEFQSFLDRSTGTIHYASAHEGRKARRAQKEALYENQ